MCLETEELSLASKHGFQLIRDYQEMQQQNHPELPKEVPGPDPEIPDPPLPLGFKVGIIGAGVTGLYAAMILDTIGIKYDVLEASERPGGRARTHYFSNEPFDYFDLGATRFPNIPIMDRTFDLFTRLHIPLTNYRTKSDNEILLYNNQRVVGVEQPPPDDVFRFGRKYGGPVPQKYIEKGHGYWIGKIIEPFREEFKKSWKDGWRLLKRYDEHSIRSIMATGVDDPIFKKEMYPSPVIDWCESRAFGAGVYNLALSKAVIRSLTFDGNFWGTNPKTKWFCITGGAQVLIDAMIQQITTEPTTGHRVTAISPNSTGICATVMDLDHKISQKEYSHIISTIPISTLRLVDLSECGLGTAANMGIRSIHYIPCVRIGLKFKSRWWQNKCNIRGGSSNADLLMHSIVYPSYGIDDLNGSAVLLASYSFSTDAIHLRGLIQGHDTFAEKLLVDLALRDLAKIHTLPLDDLRSEFIDHFAWDWSSNEYSNGALPQYEPGQFECLYPCLTQPAAAGKLHFVGEALSVNHGWVVGALDSAYRGVMEVLCHHNQYSLVNKLIQIWGKVDEVDLKLLMLQEIYGTQLSGELMS